MEKNSFAILQQFYNCIFPKRYFMYCQLYLIYKTVEFRQICNILVLLNKAFSFLTIHFGEKMERAGKKFCAKKYIWSYNFRPQSYIISSKADLRQEIKRDFEFSRYHNGTFYWRKCFVKTLVIYLRTEDLYLLLFSFGLMDQLS